MSESARFDAEACQMRDRFAGGARGVPNFYEYSGVNGRFGRLSWLVVGPRTRRRRTGFLTNSCGTRV